MIWMKTPYKVLLTNLPREPTILNNSSFLTEECLDYVRKSPVLICSSCLVVFQHIPSFQVHIQTCCSPPRTEIQPKLDHTAMDLLARSLWKQVFLKQFHSLPANRVFRKFQIVLFFSRICIYLTTM